MLAKKKYALAGVAGFLAALTRSQGILLVIPFAAEFLSDLRKSQGKFAFKDIVRKGIFIFGAPLGLLGYLLINYSVYRNPFQFMIFQNQNWNSSISWFWNTAVYLTDYFFYYLRKGDIRLILGLSIPNILALWGTLALIAAGAKKRRASLTLYSLAYFAMCFGHSWLLSGPRYALCLFPVFMTLAELVKGRKWLNNTVTAAMLFMFAAYLSFFISRYGVV